MNVERPMVRLAEVLSPSDEKHVIESDAEYQEITVRLWGKGVILRKMVSGVALAGQSRHIVHSDQYILSRIDARNGASGIIPLELDGAVVTSDFPVFNIDSGRLSPKYLGWLCRTATFVAQCRNASEGTTNRVRLQEDEFLKIEIPLPPVAEQQRIVGRIEELQARVNDACALRRASSVETAALLPSMLHDVFVNGSADWHEMPMTESVEINAKQVDPTTPFYSALPHISGENIQSKTCRLLPWRTAAEDGIRSGNYFFRPGTILYSKIRPYLRKAAYLDFQGLCSADVYPVKVVSDELDPNFVKWTLVAEPFSDYANRISGRTRMPKLNRKQFFGFVLRYPSLTEQRRIVARLETLQTQLAAMEHMQAQTANELDGILPSILDRAFKGELL